MYSSYMENSYFILTFALLWSKYTNKVHLSVTPKNVLTGYINYHSDKNRHHRCFNSVIKVQRGFRSPFSTSYANHLETVALCF
jgi:hypothetical protein